MRLFVLLLIALLGGAGLSQGPKSEVPASGKDVDPFAPSQRRVFEGAEADLKLLNDHQIESSDAALLAFFKKRTLQDSERPKIAALVDRLAAPEYRKREQAAEDLVRTGPPVLEFLRKAAQGEDLEMVRRAEQCISRIRSTDLVADVPAAAVRILGQRRPEGTITTLLDFLPYADSEYVADEIRTVMMKVVAEKGTAAPELVSALKNSVPARRALAAEVLARSRDVEATVRALLKDPEPQVRLRAALGRIRARDKSAVPVLIEAIPLVSNVHAWPAEDLLLRLSEGNNPPIVSRGADAESRKKFREAWQTWWTRHEGTIDLARLDREPTVLGHTVLVLLDLGQVAELNAKNEIVWQIDGLEFPLDLQVLPNGNVVVAEYKAGRVTERDRLGKVRWEKSVAAPLMAQRLTNRHTFVATDSQLFEFDEAGNERFSFTLPGVERFMKVSKLPNGEIAALTSESRVVRYDEKGRELQSFTINLQSRLFGGRIHMLPNGRVLVPHHGESKVVEYDMQGQAVWEVNVPQPVAAVRLANGNTLVTTYQPQTGAIEYDRNGREVWHYRHETRVTRALRR